MSQRATWTPRGLGRICARIYASALVSLGRTHSQMRPGVATRVPRDERGTTRAVARAFVLGINALRRDDEISCART
jgi:hypothetical protein